MCAVVCSLFVAVGALGASTALATTRTLTFPYDGLTGVEGVPQFWEVPPKVYLVTFRVFGAQGGKRPGRPYSGAGGRGGEVTATLPVKPGELFEINVGGMPGNGRTGKLLGLFSSGGFNGGGAGGGGPYMGGGGGGASDVRHSPFGLTERLLVAGGGGGGGAPGSGSELIGSYIGPGDGGAGGGMSGRGGNAGGCGSPGGGGGNDRGGGAGASCVLPGPEPQGGSQDSGGHGGLPNGESCLEYGGSAPGGGVYDYTRTFIGGGGGGGGGGYYGGGGGGAGDASSGYHIDPYDSAQNFTYCYGDGGSGGGGGSGFGPPGAVFRSGARGGDGLVTVTFTPNCSHGSVCLHGVPGAPKNVEAVASNHKAKVAFATPTVSTPMTYKVTASPGGKTATGSNSPVVVKGLKNGTKYTFTVIAANELGTSKRSKRSNQVTPAPPPGAPTNVKAVALNHEAVVSFTAAKSRWSPIVAYKVIVNTRTRGPERDAGSTFTADSVIPSPAPGGGAVSIQPLTMLPGSKQPVTSPITVNGLADGFTYTFIVTATNKIGTGPWSIPSNPVTLVGPPQAPTGVTASAGNAQATISFTRPYANGSRITSYTVTASPGGATVTGKRSPLTLTGLSNGTAYTFTVTATNALGTSPASAPSSAVTPLGGFVPTVRLVRGSQPQRR